MKHAVATYLLLYVAWLGWSGHTEPLLLVFGALSCLVALGLSLRMKIVDRESHPYHLGLRPLRYLPWLLKEIVKANLAVARIILDPKLPINPHLIRVHPSQKTPVGQVSYANSITLTPGTITLDVRDGTILVHALTEKAAAGLAGGEMDRRVTRMEGAG